MISEETDQQTKFDGLVEAFESARAKNSELNMAEFLPSRDDPIYGLVRRELVRVDLEWSWHEGRRTGLREYALIFPDLMEDRTAVEEIAFEEYRLRLLAGEAPTPMEFEEKYGVTTRNWAKETTSTQRKADSWRDVLPARDPSLNINRDATQEDTWHGSRLGEIAQSLLLDSVHQSHSEADFLLAQAMTDLPAVGTRFLNFQLIAELGRGSFGCVYLASQGDLAHRYVALKITLDLLGEDQKLAQLQHTNVVPIYSIHQAGAMQAVCMPYFGSTTFSDVIQKVQVQSAMPRSGKILMDTILERRAVSRNNLPAAALEQEEPVTLRRFAESSYVDAVLWLAERTTEGLIHAHERGILHQDLKPANILLTDEGEPMLLDFNLSADVKACAPLGDLQVGGTIPYMAPEQMEALLGGERQVDARSDIYALGVVLFELLTGKLPFEMPPGRIFETLPTLLANKSNGPALLRPLNPAVSPAVESLIRHCMQADPNQRYQSAENLRDDLRRQRLDLPLQYAPEPSMRERMQKWVRRHPRLTSPAGIASMATVLLALCLTPFLWQLWEQWQIDRADHEAAIIRAQIADEEMKLAQKDSASVKATKAALDQFSAFQKSASPRTLMETVSLVQLLPEARPYEEKRLEDALKALDQYHVLDDQEWQTQLEVTALPPTERRKLVSDIAEVAYVLAQPNQVREIKRVKISREFAAVRSLLASHEIGLAVWSAWEAVPPRLALLLNERACSCFPAEAIPQPIAMQRADLLRLSIEESEYEHLRAKSEATPLRDDSEDRYWMACLLAAQGKFKKAGRLAGEAIKQAPDHFGAQLLLAMCLHNQGQLAEAEEAYTKAALMRPNKPWVFYQRGSIYLRRNEGMLAARDFDKVLKQYPDFARAYILRAEALQSANKISQAIEGITEAIRLMPDHGELYYLRAVMRDRILDTQEAKLDRRRSLEMKPIGAEGWAYRAMLNAPSNPRGALRDFDEALAINPDSILALYGKANLLADHYKSDTEAVECLDRVLELDRYFVQARIKRGLLLAGLGNRAKAVADAEEAVELDESPHCRYQAAVIYAQTSQMNPIDQKRALELLGFALRNGYGVQGYQKDAQLTPLQNHPDFGRFPDALKILGSGDLPRMRPK